MIIIMREATRDPIFLFQSRSIAVLSLPDGISTDGDSIMVERAEFLRDWHPSLLAIFGDEIEEGVGWGRFAEALVGIERPDGGVYAKEEWITERVFLTRDEGEAWARAREHRWARGWRVYCVPAEGALAELLKTFRIVKAGT